MNTAKAIVLCCLAVFVFVASPAPVSARSLESFKGVRLGMTYKEVLRTLEKRKLYRAVPGTKEGFSVNLLHPQFRHASYHFDAQGRLVRVDLTMREVLNRADVLRSINRRFHTRLKDGGTVVNGDLQLAVANNKVIIEPRDGTKIHASSRPSPDTKTH